VFFPGDNVDAPRTTPVRAADGVVKFAHRGTRNKVHVVPAAAAETN
jgi:hypothetical protein